MGGNAARPNVANAGCKPGKDTEQGQNHIAKCKKEGR